MPSFYSNSLPTESIYAFAAFILVSVVAAPAYGQPNTSSGRAVPLDIYEKESQPRKKALPTPLPASPAPSPPPRAKRRNVELAPPTHSATPRVTAPVSDRTLRQSARSETTRDSPDLQNSLSAPALSNLPTLGDTGRNPAISGPAPRTAAESPARLIATPQVPEASQESVPVSSSARTIHGKPAGEPTWGGRLPGASEVANLITEAGLQEHEVDLLVLNLSTGDDLLLQNKAGLAVDAYESALEYTDGAGAVAVRMALNLRLGVALAEQARELAGALQQDAFARSEAVLKTALEYWQDQGDRWRVSMAKQNLALCHGYAADAERDQERKVASYQSSQQWFQEAQDALEKSKQEVLWAQLEKSLALAYQKLAGVNQEPQQNLERAQERLETALPILEKLATALTYGDAATAYMQIKLDAALLEPDAAAATALVEKGLTKMRDVLSLAEKNSLLEVASRARMNLGMGLVRILESPRLSAHPGAAAEAASTLQEALATLDKATQRGRWLNAQRNLALATMRAAAGEKEPEKAMAYLDTALEALRAAKDAVNRRDSAQLYGALHFQIAEALTAKMQVAPKPQLSMLLQQCLGSYTVAQEVHSRESSARDWAVIEVAKARTLLRFAGAAGGEPRNSAIARARQLLEGSRPQWSTDFALPQQAECFRMLAQAHIAENLTGQVDLADTEQRLRGIVTEALALQRTAVALNEAGAVQVIVTATIEQIADFAFSLAGTRSQVLLEALIQAWGDVVEEAGSDAGAGDRAGTLLTEMASAEYKLGAFNPGKASVDHLQRAANYFKQAREQLQPGADTLAARVGLVLQEVKAVAELAGRLSGAERQERLRVAARQVDASIAELRQNSAALGVQELAEFLRDLTAAKLEVQMELALLTDHTADAQALRSSLDELETMRSSMDAQADAQAWVEVTNYIGRGYSAVARLTEPAGEKRQLLARAVARHHQVLTEQMEILTAYELSTTSRGLAEALLLLVPLEKPARHSDLLRFAVETFRDAATAVDSTAYPLPYALSMAGRASALLQQSRFVSGDVAMTLLDEAFVHSLDALKTLNGENLPIAWAKALAIHAEIQMAMLDGKPSAQGAEASLAALEQAMGMLSPNYYPGLWRQLHTQKRDVLLNGTMQPAEAFALCQEWLASNPSDAVALSQSLQSLYAAGNHDAFLEGVAPVLNATGDASAPVHLLYAMAGGTHLEADREMAARELFRQLADLPAASADPQQREFGSPRGVRRYLEEHRQKLGVYGEPLLAYICALSEGDSVAAAESLRQLNSSGTDVAVSSQQP